MHIMMSVKFPEKPILLLFLNTSILVPLGRVCEFHDLHFVDIGLFIESEFKLESGPQLSLNFD